MAKPPKFEGSKADKPEKAKEGTRADNDKAPKPNRLVAAARKGCK